MTDALLLFQADQWKESVLAGGSTPIDWKSGLYPNSEQWVKFDFPKEKYAVLTVLAGFHDREPLDVQIMRLLLVLEAARRTADKVRLFLPYLPYSLQDRDVHGGDAVAARVLMRAIESIGIDSIAVADLHNPNSLKEWSILAEERLADQILVDAIEKVYDRADVAIVAPDAGTLDRAKRIAKLLEAPLIELDKVRHGPGDVTVSGTIESCSAQHYILVDDMINTGGTIVEAAKLVREQCHVHVSVAVVHGLFAGQAREKLQNSEVDHLFVTNSFNSSAIQSDKLPANWHVADIAPLFQQ